MKPIIALLSIVTCLASAVSASAQPAAKNCPEGKTLDGQCISAELGAAGRQRGVCITVREFPGPTGGCGLPRSDVLYRDAAWFSHLRNFGLGPHGGVYIYRR